MSPTSNLLAAFLVAGSLTLSIGPRSYSQEKEGILVDDPRPVPRTPDHTRPIVGIRAATASFVDAANIKVGVGDRVPGVVYLIPERTVIDSWKMDQGFAAALQEASGLKGSSLSIADIQKAGIQVEKFVWAVPPDDYKSFKPVVVAESGELVDSAAIIELTKHGMLDLSKRYKDNFTDDPTEQSMIALNSLNPLGGAFLDYLEDSRYRNYPIANPKNPIVTPNELLVTATMKHSIDPFKSLQFALGDASFGASRVRSSREARFNVDQQISRENDVYLIEFAFTLYDLPVEQLDEISFRLACPDVCRAWELAPLRVGREESKQITIKTPEISVNGFSVGEFFGQTIAYKVLKPQIVAYGVREDEFSWSLKEDAMSTGSFIFLAAVGVPKGTKNLEIKKYIVARTKESILAEGRIVSTDPIVEKIDLK